MRFVLVLSAVLCTLAAFADELPRGELVTIETSLDDSHSYVLYLPTDYAPDEQWPILYCLDARYRGELVASTFRDAAERYGWILACSNNTASDGPIDPNVVAMRYLWFDTHERLAIDDSRTYATGFSGVSRFLWHFPALKIPIAGAIGVGGGTPWPSLPDQSIPFVYYGIVGDEDFNWAEMHELADALEERTIPNRLDVFDGPHSWPDSDTAERAVRWMELRAVIDGLEDADPNQIEAWAREDLERFDSLISEDRLAEAADLERWIRRDYGELMDSFDLRVENETRLSRARAARDGLVDEELEWIAEAEEPVAILLQPEAGNRQRARARKGLELEKWKERAEGGDSDLARSATRRLSAVFGQLSYYLPNLFIERDELERAMTSLGLASEIYPESPSLHYQRARVLTKIGRHDDAVSELKKMLDVTSLAGSRLAEDENFEALRENERFQELIGKEDGE